MTTESILVGMDVSETVEEALAVTVDLAVMLDASVQAVYVEDTSFLPGRSPRTAPLPPRGRIPLRDAELQELEERYETEESILGRCFLELVSDRRIQGAFSVEQGDVSAVLVKASRAHDLVVLGKYGESQSSAGRTVPPLGAHVGEVVRRSYVPVVLVPPGARLGNRILIAYDGSSAAHRALSMAVHVGKKAGARLAALTVTDPEHGETLLDEVRRYFESHQVEGDLACRQGDAARTILDFAAEWEANTLAMGAFGQGTLRQTRGQSATPAILQGVDRVAILCGPLGSN